MPAPCASRAEHRLTGPGRPSVQRAFREPDQTPLHDEGAGWWRTTPGSLRPSGAGSRPRASRSGRRRRRPRALDGRRGLLRRRSCSTSCCPGATASRCVPTCGPPATGRRSWCSRPRTASSTRPRRSTPGPTTTSPSRSRTRCSWPASGRCSPVGPDGAVPRSTVGRPPARSVPPAGLAGRQELALTAREFDVLEPPRASGRRRCVPSRISSPRCGTTTSRATPTSSRSTSRRLRRKVDEPFGRRSIETVRGAGYRLVDDPGLIPTGSGPAPGDAGVDRPRPRRPRRARPGRSPRAHRRSLVAQPRGVPRAKRRRRPRRRRLHPSAPSASATTTPPTRSCRRPPAVRSSRQPRRCRRRSPRPPECGRGGPYHRRAPPTTAPVPPPLAAFRRRRR